MRASGDGANSSAPPRVSVVMPAHNSAATVREAVLSILKQTLTNLELIVVNDGSTDETEKVVGSINDPRLRFVHQANEGYPSAMNRGLAVARGEFVARMDADDVAAADRLQCQVEFLESRPDYGAVGTLYDFLTPNGKTVRHEAETGKDPWSDVTWEDILDGRRTFADPSVMFRAETARRAGGYRTYQRSGQDVDLWLRLVEQGRKFAVLNRVLYSSRMSLGALTGRPLTGAYNKVPRFLARERRDRGNDRVMRGEPLDDLLTQESLDRAAFWHVRDLWLKSRRCFLAGDVQAGVRFSFHAAVKGGVNRNNIGHCWELLHSIVRGKRGVSDSFSGGS